MADVKWIKITTDMFDNRKIKHLRRLPEGDSIVLIWVMLLTLAGRCNSNGMIFLTENIPYTPKMLADELDFEENTVRLALNALEQLDMVRSDGFLTITGWEDHQNIEGLEKLKILKSEANARAYQKRKQQKMLAENSVADSVTDKTTDSADSVCTDKDKDKKKKKNKIITYSDDPDLNQAILSFVEFRKSIKKPMTERAVELLIKKLDGMGSTSEQIEIINQSIMNGWQGVFPLKNDSVQPIKQSFYQKQSKADELNAAYNMMTEWGST